MEKNKIKIPTIILYILYNLQSKIIFIISNFFLEKLELYNTFIITTKIKTIHELYIYYIFYKQKSILFLKF